MDHESNTPTNNTELFKVDDTDLRMVNRFLALCAVALVFLVAIRARNIEHRLSMEQKTHSGAPYVPAVPAEFASQDHYVAAVSSRNIFMPAAGETDGDGQLPDRDLSREKAQEELRKMRQDLLVVGIAWREPRIVMLLDKRQKKTYHVREGQRIGDSDVYVESISRTEIKIGLQNERLSL